MGWLFLVTGLLFALNGLSYTYAEYAVYAVPGRLPGASVVVLGWSMLEFTAPLLVLSVLLFPDGRLPSGRWRPVAAMIAAAIVSMALAHLVRPGSFENPFAIVSNPFGREPTSSPGIAIEGGRVVVSWVVGGISESRMVLASERPTATAAFEAPTAVSAPTKVPHWIDPRVSLVDGHALVAWVQGVAHTTTHDRAALAIRSGDGAWQPPILRSVRAPAHVSAVNLLARAPGRPPIVALTFSRAFRYRLLTASLRADGTLGPSRLLATGGAAGYTPWLAQGARHAWLATERLLGTGRHMHIQALLFRSG